MLFWPEISALGVFLNFDNEHMYPPKYLPVIAPPPHPPGKLVPTLCLRFHLKERHCVLQCFSLCSFYHISCVCKTLLSGESWLWLQQKKSTLYFIRLYFIYIKAHLVLGGIFFSNLILTLFGGHVTTQMFCRLWHNTANFDVRFTKHKECIKA